MRALSRTGYLAALLCIGSLSAFHSRAQTAPPPIISPALAEAASEPLTAKGLKLLDKAIWRQTSSQNKVKLSILKGTLIGQTSIPRTGNGVPSAIDAKTGKNLWSAASTPLLSNPQEAADSGILFFEETIQSLTQYALAADTGAQTEIWRWNTPKVPQSTLFRILPKAILAGDQVIVSGETIVNGGGSIVGLPPQLRDILALDRKTGKELWKTPLEEKAVSAFSTFHDGKIYLLVKQSVDAVRYTAKSQVVALDASNGKILWSTPLFDTLLFPPAIHGNWVVSENETGEVFALDAKTGQEKWRTTLSPDCDPAKSEIASTSVAAGSLFFDNTTVLAPANSKLDMTALPAGVEMMDQAYGAFAAFNLQTGQQTAYFGGIKKKIQKPKNATSQFIQTPSSAINILQINNGLIYAKTSEEVLAIDPKTMKPLWRIPAVGAAIAENILFINTTRVTEDIVRDRQSEIFAIPLSSLEK